MVLAAVAVLFVPAVAAVVAPLSAPKVAEGTEPPLTVEELSELLAVEVMAAAPTESRQVIAAQDAVQTTFEACDPDGAPGLKVRTAGVTTLTDLTLDGQRAADLVAISGLSGLQTLSLRDAVVGDHAALAGLTSLDLSGSDIADIAPLGQLASPCQSEPCRIRRHRPWTPVRGDQTSGSGRDRERDFRSDCGMGAGRAADHAVASDGRQKGQLE